MTIEAARHAVLALRDLSESAYVLRIERKGLDFEPGQYIHVGPLPGIDRREYSVYSAPGDDFLEILVKEVPEGVVSPSLRRLAAGEHVDVEGPFGFFRIEEGDLAAPFLFIATGTGISPFHCHTRSRPQLDYTLIHGVRSVTELYDHGAYDAGRLVSCISRPEGAPAPAGTATGGIAPACTPSAGAPAGPAPASASASTSSTGAPAGPAPASASASTSSAGAPAGSAPASASASTLSAAPPAARNFRGRVTDWLRENPAPENCMAYLCGSCDMIYEVYDILGAQGLSSDRIHAEVYF